MSKLVLDVMGDLYGDSYNVAYYSRQLNSYDGDNIELPIHSKGGDVFEGMAIYSLLKNHSASVQVNIIGIAASMATGVAMCADKRPD